MGADADTLDGNARHSTLAMLGTGDDTFVWDPGDGNDVVEGGADQDELRFNGSAGRRDVHRCRRAEHGCLFTRNIGNILMDVDDVEAVVR